MRLGVVGCGAVAEFFHLPAIAAELGRDEVWLVDPDLEHARALARRFGRVSHVAVDHRGLELDAAIVAVPNDLHAELAADLLRRGIHVLCEKPLARTADEGRRIVEAAGPGTVLAIGNFRRCFPSTQLVRDLLERRALGAVTGFRAEEGFVYSWGTRSGFSLDRRRAGGGVLIDLGSHALDQLRFWLGPQLEVKSYRDDAHGGIEADCVVELGAGTVELSRTRALGSRIALDCEKGTIEAPLARSGPVTVCFGDGRREELGGEPGPDGGYGAAFRAQLRAFLDGRPVTTGEEGLAVLELIDACYARRELLPEPWVTEAA